MEGFGGFASTTTGGLSDNVFLIRFSGLLCCLLCLVACDRLPESYPPPEQRPPITGARGPDAMMASMAGPDADSSSSRTFTGFGNAPGAGASGNRPSRCWWFPTKISSSARTSQFGTTPSRALARLKFRFFVNGKLLDKVRYTTPGGKHFEKPVPSGWLAPTPKPPWLCRWINCTPRHATRLSSA
jgi:hypothetical protein